MKSKRSPIHSRHSQGESVNVLTSLIRKISFRGIDLLSRSTTPDYRLAIHVNKKVIKKGKEKGGKKDNKNLRSQYRGNHTKPTKFEFLRQVRAICFYNTLDLCCETTFLLGALNAVSQCRHFFHAISFIC